MAIAALAGTVLPVGLAVIGGTGSSAASTSAVTMAALAARPCRISGPVKGLTSAQAANAEAVVAAATVTTGADERVAQIALMTAVAQSQLENVNNPRGELFGLFQERPGHDWGTAPQLMNPTYATEAFVSRVLAVPKWSSLQPWLVAEDVQRYRVLNSSTYKGEWPKAGRVLSAVMANADAPGGCGQGVGRPAGSGHGLPSGYVIPPGTLPEHARIVRFALAQLGKPYLWGGAGPDAYDCSGLTMAAWATAGVQLVHAASIQQTEGGPVVVADLAPGDLVLVPGTDSPGPGLAGHVGIYLGDGLVLSAIDTQYGVAVQSWATFISGGLIALRDPAPGL